MGPSWQDIENAFDKAAELDGEARAEFLRSIADPALRQEVESLFAAEERGGTTLSGMVSDVAATIDDESVKLKSVGPWSILRLLASGGMGAVYLAERQGEGFSQKAALKLLLRGFEGRFFVSRFRQERRILATLDHPHIARLLDGGTADDGRPYLALEFIDGPSITEFCKDLSTERRLELFLDVCNAVEHAHQRMVIHRDLKPSNILVNREGQVKLLDFGIAKMLDSETSGASVALTGTGVKLMTPDYAAPEQIRGETITTATDVYCLGLVLHELLTGRKPLPLPKDAPLEAARIICERDPEPAGMSPDIDAVILKCLRKEPAARYAAVSGLREDLERVLRGDAVTAYRGAWTYRAVRWIRRYRWGVGAVALLLIAIGGGVASTAREARIAQRRYEDVRELARTVIFDVYDQVEMLPAATKARETIVNTALRYLEGMRSDAQSDPGLAMELAAAYVKVGDVLGYPRMANLGRMKEAVESFEKAKVLYWSVAAREPLRPGVNGGLGRVAARFAAVANTQQRLAEALRLSDEAERYEAAEYAVSGKKDLDLLVHVDHERFLVASFQQDAAGSRQRCLELLGHGEELDRRHSDANSRYWVSCARGQAILADAYAGEPTAAVKAMLSHLVAIEREVAKEDAHLWLKSDLTFYEAALVNLYSGLTVPSAGNPAEAVRVADARRLRPKSRQAADRADLRVRTIEVMQQCVELPARSYVDAAAGFREFLSIRHEIHELESRGHSDVFDDSDYLLLSVGGVRALRLLGRREEAAAQAQTGLKRVEALKEGDESPHVAHGENVLRFEQALLGIDIGGAVQKAVRVQKSWPLSLLLKGDVVKILALSGARAEAAKVLASMPACEYRRRLESEFRKNKFFD